MKNKSKPLLLFLHIIFLPLKFFAKKETQEVVNDGINNSVIDAIVAEKGTNN
jgi:hypothetical protein